MKFKPNMWLWSLFPNTLVRHTQSWILASLLPTARHSLMLASAQGSVSGSAIPSPVCRLFLPWLRDMMISYSSAANTSRLLIPNFYLIYIKNVHNWLSSTWELICPEQIRFPTPIPSLALKVFLILVLAISLSHFFSFSNSRISLVAVTVRSLPGTQEMWFQSLGWKDLWRKEWLLTPIFSFREFHGQWSLLGYTVHVGLQKRVRHQWVTNSNPSNTSLGLRVKHCLLPTPWT